MQIKLLNYGLENMPKRAHANDAGADVYALEDITLFEHKTKSIGLGFGIELPAGFMAIFMPRSGMSSKGIGAHLPPVDSSYTGEVHAVLCNTTNVPYQIKKGDRIAQMVIVPVMTPTFTLDELDKRGDNGFGSTGA